MKNKVFRSIVLQEEFEEKGYVKIPCLSAKEVKAAKQGYDALEHTQAQGFHCSMFHPNEDYRKSINTLVLSTLGNKLDDVLDGYKKLFGNFVVKEPGETSDLYVHQDWSFVDEEQHISLAIWVPLVDVTLKNGPLYLVPGTHKIENIVRGPGVPDPYDELHDVIREKYGEKQTLKAGEALIWHHRTVHFSPANHSDSSRVALTSILVPKEAEVLHFWAETKDGNPNQEVEQFSVNQDFYMEHNVQERPNMVESQGWVKATFPRVSEAALRKVVSASTGRRPGFLDRVKELIGITR